VSLFIGLIIEEKWRENFYLATLRISSRAEGWSRVGLVLVVLDDTGEAWEFVNYFDYSTLLWKGVK
jgi:hypothetical protein